MMVVAPRVMAPSALACAASLSTSMAGGYPGARSVAGLVVGPL